MDPFFSSKDAPDASGLGLSICFSIIRNHRGEMTLESQPGHGFEVTIVLPHGERPVPRASKAEVAAGIVDVIEDLRAGRPPRCHADEIGLAVCDGYEPIDAAALQEPSVAGTLRLERPDLPLLLLGRDGAEPLGPSMREGAVEILLDPLDEAALGARLDVLLGKG